jgi:hypothetical protein
MGDQDQKIDNQGELTEESQKVYDEVFDMSTEDFNKSLESGEINLGGDASDGDGGASDEDQNIPAHKPAPAAKPTPKQGTENVFTITHNGVEHNLDRDRMIELAQKGFDYDTKVGPHRRIVQLLDSDPNAQFLMNNYFMQKLGLAPPTAQAPSNFPAQQPHGAPATPPQTNVPADPNAQQDLDLSGVKLKRLADFDSEQEWLMDSMDRVMKAAMPSLRQPPPQPQSAPQVPGHQPQSQFPGQPVGPQQAQQAQQVVMNAIQSYDPESSSLVIPHIDRYAGELSHAEYVRITSSMPDFLDFYDQVKAEVLSNSNQNLDPNQNSGRRFNPNPPGADRGNQGGKKKRFTLKPAGTPRTKTGGKQLPNVWDLPQSRFEDLVNSKINNPGYN